MQIIATGVRPSVRPFFLSPRRSRNSIIRVRESDGVSHPQDSLRDLDQLFSSSFHDCFSVRTPEVFNHEVRKLKNSQSFQRTFAQALVYLFGEKNNFVRSTLSHRVFSIDIFPFMCLFSRVHGRSSARLGSTYVDSVRDRSLLDTERSISSLAPFDSAQLRNSFEFRFWLLDLGVEK